VAKLYPTEGQITRSGDHMVMAVREDEVARLVIEVDDSVDGKDTAEAVAEVEAELGRLNRSRVPAMYNLGACHRKGFVRAKYDAKLVIRDIDERIEAFKIARKRLKKNLTDARRRARAAAA